MKIIKLLKENIFWLVVASIIILLTVVAILAPTGEKTLLEQLGYEIGKIGKAIADGFGRK